MRGAAPCSASRFPWLQPNAEDKLVSIENRRPLKCHAAPASARVALEFGTVATTVAVSAFLLKRDMVICPSSQWARCGGSRQENKDGQTNIALAKNYRMKSLENATGLLAFVRAVEAGSFSAAARLAGSTPSAISKSVERLERRLGIKMFRRSTRSLSLTTDGAAYYERIAPLLQALEDADEVLGDAGSARGRLRISLPGILGPILVDGLTRDFVSIYPDIALEISITDRHVDLVREGFDVALRVGEVTALDWIARSLGKLSLILVASPAYLERAMVPASAEDLAEKAHIRYLLGSRASAIVFANGSRLETGSVLDTDSGQAMRIAALNGVGIAQLLRAAVAEDLAAGRLMEVLPTMPLASVPVQALHAFGRFPPLRVRLFNDFIASALAPHTTKG